IIIYLPDAGFLAIGSPENRLKSLIQRGDFTAFPLTKRCLRFAETSQQPVSIEIDFISPVWLQHSLGCSSLMQEGAQFGKRCIGSTALDLVMTVILATTEITRTCAYAMLHRAWRHRGRCRRPGAGGTGWRVLY